MPTVITLPAQEDQMNFRNGVRPENYFVREYEADAEAMAYAVGIDHLPGENYEVIAETENSVTIFFGEDDSGIVSIDSRVFDREQDALDHCSGVVDAGDLEEGNDAKVGDTFTFKNEACKKAFLQGIDDASGFINPVVYIERNDEEFEELRQLLAANSPKM